MYRPFPLPSALLLFTVCAALGACDDRALEASFDGGELVVEDGSVYRPDADGVLQLTGALDPADSVFVPLGYNREDLVEATPGTFAPFDQVESVRLVQNAWDAADAAGIERPLASEVLGGSEDGRRMAGGYYTCTASTSSSQYWLGCAGVATDNCATLVYMGQSYKENLSSGSVLSDESELDALMGMLTESNATSVVMLAVDGEIGDDTGTLYAHPTGHAYHVSSLRAEDIDVSSYIGPTSFDFIPDSSGYELEFIANRSSGKTVRKNFTKVKVTPICTTTSS